MASLEVCALAHAEGIWLPGGAAGCVPGGYMAAGQAASSPVALKRSRAPPRAIPASSQSKEADSRVLRRRRHLPPDRFSCRINFCRLKQKTRCHRSTDRTEV